APAVGFGRYVISPGPPRARLAAPARLRLGAGPPRRGSGRGGPLARRVGAKGYHDRVFEEGPYPGRSSLGAAGQVWQHRGGEEPGALGAGDVAEVDGEAVGALSHDAEQRLRHLGRRADQLHVTERADPRRRLQPLDVPLAVPAEDADAHHLLDLIVVAADLATVRLQHLLLLRVRVGPLPDVVPPVGVPGDHAQQELLPRAAHHDRRDRLRARLAVRARDAVVLPVVVHRAAGPHPPDQLDGLRQLRDADLGGGAGPAVGQVLLLVPAGA